MSSGINDDDSSNELNACAVLEQILPERSPLQRLELRYRTYLEFVLLGPRDQAAAESRWKNSDRVHNLIWNYLEECVIWSLTIARCNLKVILPSRSGTKISGSSWSRVGIGA
jgi:hypothetical protein